MKRIFSSLGFLVFCALLCFGYVFGLDNSASPEISSGNGTEMAAQASEGDGCTHVPRLELLWTAMEEVPLTPSRPYPWHLILRYEPGLCADDELPVITWKLYRDGTQVDTHQTTFTSMPVPFGDDPPAGRYAVTAETEEYGPATYESYLFTKFASITCDDPHVVSKGNGSNGQTIETVSVAPDSDGVTVLMADNTPDGTPWGDYTPEWSHSSLSSAQFEYIGRIGSTNRASGMKIFNAELTPGQTHTISASSATSTRMIKVRMENPRVDSITASGNGKTKTVKIDSDSSLSNENAFYILQGNVFTLTANHWPASQTFPVNNPTWYGLMTPYVQGATVMLPRTPTITAKNIIPSGTYNVYASYNGSRYIRVIVAEQLVKSISGGGKTSDLDPDEPITDSETIYIPQGTPLTLTAAPEPSNSTFPSGKPAWSGIDSSYLSATTGASITISGEAPSGEYVISVACNNTKVIKVVIFTITLLCPIGDPETDPSDNNEFVFDDSSEGKLTINLSASVTPSSAFDHVKNSCTFEVDDIAGSTKTWDIANSNGQASVSDGNLIAKVEFIGLPANNTSFGLKTAKVKYGGTELDTNPYEVFFDRDKANHPTCTACAICPNWFYYWRQVYSERNIYYVNEDVSGQVPAMRKWLYINAIDETRIEIGKKHPGKFKGYIIGEETSGIDRFIMTVIHEKKHVDQIEVADALLATDGADSFRYGWSWNASTHNHWTKGADGEWGVAGVDDDGNGTIDDAAIAPPFEPGNGDDTNLSDPLWANKPASWVWIKGKYEALPSPIEREAVKAADDAMDENHYGGQDWGSPGKNHRTLNKWDD